MDQGVCLAEGGVAQQPARLAVALEVDLDAVDLAAANGGRFANGGFELTFQPTIWHPGLTDNQLTSIVVYAHPSVTGQEMSVQQSIVIDLP